MPERSSETLCKNTYTENQKDLVYENEKLYPTGPSILGGLGLGVGGGYWQCIATLSNKQKSLKVWIYVHYFNDIDAQGLGKHKKKFFS